MSVKKTKISKKKLIKKPATKSKAVKSKAIVKKPQTKKTPTKKVVSNKTKNKAPVVKKAVKKAVKKIAKKVDSKKPNISLKQKSSSAKESKISLAKTILAKTKIQKKEEQKPIEKKPEIKETKPFAFKKIESSTKSKINFKIGEYAVYPSHGIGKIIDIETNIVLGKEFKCYLMYFEREKLTIKIPVNSAEKIGIRHLISKSEMDEVFTILRSGVKKLKGMWSRRAQEYETKINSGDIMLLAEVLRDLTRDIEDSERSYSERIIYETAIQRLASEYSAIYGIDFEEAKEKVIMTAKDKLNSEGKISQKDGFDEFDLEERSGVDEDEEEDDEEEEEEEDDFDYDYNEDDEDDEKPRKRRKK